MSRLERVANIAVLVASVGLAIVFGRTFYLNHTTSPVAGTFSRGQRIELPSEAGPAAAKPILLMILSTQCHFCNEAMPFYQILTAFHQTAPQSLRLVAVLPQSVNEASAYLAHNGIRVDRVLSLPLERIGASYTPTLLLLDSHYRVEASWVGLLDKTGQTKVLDSLRAICGDCRLPSAKDASAT
jgi:hypothetical protein